MKKNDQRMPEYSVMKPATSSDSASGRSKGARFVSARMATKNSTKAGSMNGFRKMYQFMPMPVLPGLSLTSSRLKSSRRPSAARAGETPSGIS